MMLHRLEVIPTSESHSFPEYKRFLGMPYINATEFITLLGRVSKKCLAGDIAKTRASVLRNPHTPRNEGRKALQRGWE